MQFDLSKYTELKQNGGIKLLKLGGTEGQPGEQVDGVAIAYIRKFDITQYPPKEIMGDSGPINIAEVLKAKEVFQKQMDGVNALLADMQALKVPTTVS